MQKRGKKTKSARASRTAKPRGRTPVRRAAGRKPPAGKAAGKTRRAGRGQGERTLLAAGAIAKATARAQANVRAQLGSKTLVAEKMAEDALNEAQELGL